MRLSLGLSLTCPPVLGRSGGAWSPLSLFASGESGAWYDPSDLSTLFQDAAGTIPVTGLGQPVGLMRDKSGNGNHMLQSVANKRPTYNLDADGHPCLVTDGVDDGMITSAFVNRGNALTLAMAVNVAARDTAYMLLFAGNVGGTVFVGCGQNSASTSYQWVGAISIFVNNTAIGPTRLNTLNGLAGGISKIYEARNMLITSNWPTLEIGDYPNWELEGRIYGAILTEESAASLHRQSYLNWLASKSGVSL